jgi:hypothetical protein
VQTARVSGVQSWIGGWAGLLKWLLLEIAARHGSWHVTSAAHVIRVTDPAQKQSEHIAGTATIVFRQAVCIMGGIVAKRRDSRYHSGRSRDWIKIKNPAHPAIERAMLIALSKQMAAPEVTTLTQAAQRFEAFCFCEGVAATHHNCPDSVPIWREGDPASENFGGGFWGKG